MHICRVGIGIFFGLALAGATWAFPVPPHDGFVTDTVGILSKEEEENLESVLTSYRAETSNEIGVFIIPTLSGEPIADVAVEVGRAWGVGTRENDNGILLLIALEDRELFIATGYGLEGVLPDITAKRIIEDEITPFFRRGEHAAGIRSGIDAIMQQIAGEYTSDTTHSENNNPFIWFALALAVAALLEWLVAILGRTKSWWLGGILGLVLGTFLFVLFSWWFFIPLLACLGALFDFFISQNYKKPGKTSFWAGGGWGPGGSGGGFSGFGGGSFGGGGAGGSW